MLGYTGDERWLTAVDENEADQWIIMVAEENMPARAITELEKLGEPCAAGSLRYVRAL